MQELGISIIISGFFFKDKFSIESALFGDRTPIPKEDYDRVYNSTGIDIDGRRQRLRDLMPSINKAVHRFVKFTAEIPGFANLPRRDQSVIFKGELQIIKYTAYDK